MTESDNMIEKAAARSTAVNYLPRYGMTREPFANEYKEDFYIVDDERSKRLNILIHLIQHSDLLLLVTGSRGIGKTSLLQHFLGMRTEAWRTCHIQSHAMMHPDVLYRHICDAFDLTPADSGDENRDKLHIRLAELLRGDFVPILIIDDAHELPAETLREIIQLSELHVDDAGMLRIVLFSEPQIQTILDTPLLKDIRHRITHTLDIPPLTEEQTINYIKKRLSAAGLHGDLPLTQKQMQKIFRQSNGIPLSINQLANDMLAGEQPLKIQQKTPKKPSSSRPLKSVMMLFAIIAIAGVITAAVMYDVITRLWQNDEGANVNPPAPAITLKHKPSPTAESMHKDLPLPAKQPEQVEQLPLVDLAPGVSADKSAEGTQQEAKTEVVGQIHDKDKVTVVTKSTEAKKPVVPPNTSPVAPDVATKKEPEPATAAIVEEKQLKPAKPAVVARPATKSPPVNKPVSAHLAGVAWLKAQNPGHYTVQLNASRNEQSIKDYVKQHHLTSKTTYLKTTLNGKDWYILLYGSYTNKQLARQAAAKLPAALRKAKPWPRRIGDIKPATH